MRVPDVFTKGQETSWKKRRRAMKPGVLVRGAETRMEVWRYVLIPLCENHPHVE